MINRRLIATAALAVPGLGLVQQAQAQGASKSRLKKVQESSELRIGTTGGLQPHELQGAWQRDVPGPSDRSWEAAFRGPWREAGFRGHGLEDADQRAERRSVRHCHDWGPACRRPARLPRRSWKPWGRSAFLPLVQKKNLGKYKSWTELDQALRHHRDEPGHHHGAVRAAKPAKGHSAPGGKPRPATGRSCWADGWTPPCPPRSKRRH